MAFVLRFVQKYRPADREAFMELERKFTALEKRRPDFPKGRRCQPLAGRDAAHTLVWECDFPSLEAVQNVLAFLAADGEHDELFRRQAPFIAEAHTEIYEVLEF
ncbi:MAG TPA: hypothetical protein ENN09_01535 [Planctomycetes bacterium]|nr:hypothetical protein [Planctomycetota bacterium]